MTDYQDLRDFIETTISPLVVCMLETQLMQLSVEQQDDIDRQQIALYGMQSQILTNGQTSRNIELRDGSVDSGGSDTGIDLTSVI